MKLFKLLVTLLISFTFIACNEEIVARGVDQKQANELVSIFSKSKISAKVAEDPKAKKLLMVLVDKKDYEEATTILTLKGLPKEKGATFSEMISRHGILPDSKRMEDLRLDKALSLEIEDTLSKIPEISNVSVVVRKEYLHDSNEPLVSVLVIKKPNVEYLDEEKILNIIRTIIPEIRVSNINITQESEMIDEYFIRNYGQSEDDKSFIKFSKFLGKYRVANSDYKQFSLFFIITILVSFLIGGALASIYLKFRNIKKEKSKIVEISSKDLLGKRITKKD